MFRIRQKRKLKIVTSREKRRVEKPRMPRTAKKIDPKTMVAEMGQLGVVIDQDDETVCISSIGS